MAMGVVDDEDFLKEVERLDKPLPQSKPFIAEIREGEIVDSSPAGRGNGNVEVPDSLRQLIGEEAAINGRASALGLAGELGISKSSVSAYTNAANSTASYHQQNPAIRNQISSARRRLSKKARGVLTRSLDSITDEKLNASKAIDLSTIAKNMSSIVHDMEDESNNNSKNVWNSNSAPAIVIIAPAPIDESRFEVVRSND